jgi:hypothetical protein
VQDWDGTEKTLVVGDEVYELLEPYEPCWERRIQCETCRDGAPCVPCDERILEATEQWHQQYAGPVNCCIRGGLDLIGKPSLGVGGFTVGDIRRMYPEGVPEWVFPEVMVDGDGKPVGRFEDFPDERGIWL